MDERYLVLESRIRKDLEVLEKIWRELASAELSGEEDDEKELIYIGSRLHNLHNAAENIFRNIAATFGNHVDRGGGGWHAELLERMTLDLTPLRPAVIDAAAADQLDELRRFRHVFRAVYGEKLDADRMALVLRKALALREGFVRAIEKFLDFVDRLDS